MKIRNQQSRGKKAGSFLILLALAMNCLIGFPFQTFGETSDGSFNFNDGWRFVRSDIAQAQIVGFDDRAWEAVSLPHTAHVEPLVTGKSHLQWQGICWYRKMFSLPANVSEKKVFLRFEGAMNTAEFWVNGKPAGKFMGGYLPYVMDISGLVSPGTTNVVAMRLDNTDNPLTGPKPLADLDFNLYGGLYRDAELIIQDKLHITDSILANKIAGGGLFVTFPAVSQTQALVNVQTHVQNSSDASRHFIVRTTLLDAKGHKTAMAESPVKDFPAGSDGEVSQQLEVKQPKLWSPRSPALYTVQSEIIEGGKIIDAAQTRIGIRRIEITKNGFYINGKKMFLPGANRHQEYPYIGNALSDAAQYRDALKIKEAGFDYVRCSHYPPSPAFLDACDELGIVVMDSLMGWQYFNHDPAFADLKLRECREMIRRDRNHPSVILWEVSLNESSMPETFVEKAGAIAHQEYPGDQCYTSGWQKGYDVFIQARQHGGCVGVTNQACAISEYGDWEYFAQNAGFEQEKWKDLKPNDRNSRQLRGDGEVRMLQQAMNFQEAHNDNLKTTAFGDSVWVMFDYNRGYADEIESSGVVDIFRLPKFSYWFFRSQRDANELIANDAIGPVIFIANYWADDSPLEVRVFSNCEEIALYLNGKLVERRRPDANRASTNLKHPPFTFKLDRFQPGELRAVGYIGGREAGSFTRRTPGSISDLNVQMDTTGKKFTEDERDTVFCHAILRDSAGTVVPNAKMPVFFGATGNVQLVGGNPGIAEAGIATMIVKVASTKTGGTVIAIAFVKEEDHIRILSDAVCPDGDRKPTYVVHYTTDGNEPTTKSPIYSKPISNVAQIKASAFVNAQPIIVAAFSQ
ncbi:MAG TPA: glycoside hydrolase family 2 TIM barrel-domain containing protein [Verrucomicrobiae bacterium]|nr:glycoside hydrolase family 2 TIM barrel-domain containing protein [Verrucomicrobiae bacterium]